MNPVTAELIDKLQGPLRRGRLASTRSCCGSDQRTDGMSRFRRQELGKVVQHVQACGCIVEDMLLSLAQKLRSSAAYRYRPVETQLADQGEKPGGGYARS